MLMVTAVSFIGLQQLSEECPMLAIQVFAIRTFKLSSLQQNAFEIDILADDIES
jgi:hypothetical protein